MLPQCNLEFSEQEVGLKDVEAIALKTFKNEKNVPAFLETLHFVTLTPLQKIDFSQIAHEMRRLVVFTPSMEIRFEYAHGLMHCRTLRETPGKDYVYRENKLLLRENTCQEAQWYQDGRGCVLNREYYTPDNDGLYVFMADRLAGLAS